jgi:hypothetical protein
MTSPAEYGAAPREHRAQFRLTDSVEDKQQVRWQLTVTNALLTRCSRWALYVAEGETHTAMGEKCMELLRRRSGLQRSRLSAP